MKHLTEENRKIICSMLSQHKKCWEIAEQIGCDPTTISKEIKRNRTISKEARSSLKPICKKLDRFPYVCLDCNHKYTDCTLTQMKYDSRISNAKSEYRLHETRKGINLTPEEHGELCSVIREGLANKKSIYSIITENNLKISVPTVYRYINEKKIAISKMELPYAVTYKKRKRQNKKYDYPNNGIDRSNRTYIDYLAYIKVRTNEMTIQMDFLGSIKSDTKSILTLIIPELHFVFLYIVENKNSAKVVEIFDRLEAHLGIDKFSEIFPSILTDRDPCFSDFEGIEFSDTLGVQRTNLFFCDAFRSNQKASVENMNKQLRKFFPKKASINNYSQEQIRNIAKTINETCVLSLDGYSPKEAFIACFGLNCYNELF